MNTSPAPEPEEDTTTTTGNASGPPDDEDAGSPPVKGCTDITMFGYDSNANTDDGSCVQKVSGCTDSAMFGYDPSANIDDSSCVQKVSGCTDPDSVGYDASVGANTDDGSCIDRYKESSKKKKMKGNDLPTGEYRHDNISRDDCKTLCWENDECKALDYKPGFVNNSGSRCYLKGSLGTIQGAGFFDTTQSVFVKYPHYTDTYP
tara:strand:+ start:2565 stop:3176 length:612 start_codon:yes stop_codon:yes gene_type:complete